MTVSLLRVDTGLPFVDRADLVKNDDGSVSFKLPNGEFVGQLPGIYGKRADNTDAKQYQRATLNGNQVVFMPLDENEGVLYPPYIYLIGQGQVYPA